MIAELRIPAGARAGYLEGILNMQEYELLLSRGSRFRIIDIVDDTATAFDRTINVKKAIMELVL